MGTKNCYHWDVVKTGECSECHAQVEVVEVTSVSFNIGYELNDPKVRGTFSIDWSKPSLRDAVAVAFGVTEDAVTLVDVTPRTNSWEGNTVKFRFAGSKVDLVAVVNMSPSLNRSPERVEYEPVEA